MWSAAESIGFTFILIRNIPQLLPIAIIFQNPFLLLGTLFIFIGVLRYLGRKVNLKFIFSFFASFLLLHLFFSIIQNDITTRSFIFSAYISVISFLTALKIYKYRTPSIKLSADFNTAIFVLHGAIFAYRAIMIGLGTDVSEVFSPTFLNFLPYFDALVVSLLWTFGFIIMVNQRLNFEITEAKTHFETIFNTSPDSIVISRLDDGLFIDCNESFSKLTGFTKEDFGGNSSLDINIWKNPDDRLRINRLIQENGYCESFETLFQRKDGQVITGLLSAKLLTLNGIPYIISVTHDITKRKQVEEEIKLKNEELNIVNAEKNKFFSIIAHDLRSPFNAFLGLTEIMVDEINDLTLDEIHEIARSLKNSATNIFSLLENLLDWSRMEQGLIQLNQEKFKLTQIINDSLLNAMQAAQTKEIEVTNNIAGDLMIFVDRNMFQTVIRNLVSNAIKFTPKGGMIGLSAKAINNNTIQMSINDSGIGINAQMIDNIFTLNSKTIRKGTEGEPSTGLGLILCKDFIEKLGGKIWVESEEGKGSAFHFTIPRFVENV